MTISPVESTEETERNWSSYLQRRVMRLLLLHDPLLFRGRFRTFFVESTLPQHPLFQQYDRYLRLQMLTDELLDDILPRIRRQLSLRTTQVRLREEGPTHGDIDWQRTISRNLRETPGLPPLLFDTRLRERSLDAPENVLAVAILLRFRQELQTVLREGFADESLSDQERQLLAGADERAERELAAPYARALTLEAQRTDLERLVEQVAQHLHPGASPYRDLISWWQRFNDLHVGRLSGQYSTALASNRDDENLDAWLYELWIVLECLHLLHTEQEVNSSDLVIEPDTLSFTFTWKGRRFRFIYNRQAETEGGSASGWQSAPASRPDFRIEREHVLEVVYQGEVYWREPPVILDAKYYLGGSDPVLTHSPIKKMLGDMQLLATQWGGLLFPRIASPPSGQHFTREVKQTGKQYDRGLRTETTIRLYQLTPTLPLETVQARLRNMLDYACEHLPDRPSPVCEGVWLDADSLNDARFKAPANAIFCRKRHIGNDVYDLVDAELDCLKNPRLCHVINQHIMRPIILRVTTRDELEENTETIRRDCDQALSQAEQDGDETRAEHLRNQIFFSIGRAVEQYVKLRGNTAMIEDYLERGIFGIYWKQDPRCLTLETRNLLLSGEYVWQEYLQSQLADWAAPAVQYCRALERELKRRTCAHDLSAFKKIKERDWTIGKFTTIYVERYGSWKDAWEKLVSLISNAGGNLAEFESIVQRLENEGIKSHRNDVAHDKPFSGQEAQSLRESILGSRDKPGILYCIAAHLPPVELSSTRPV